MRWASLRRLVGSIRRVDLATPDLIVLGIVALFGVRGAFKGFAWQAVRTAGLVGAIFVANLFYPRLESWLADVAGFVPAKAVIAWLALFVGVFLLVGVFAYMARGMVRSARLGSADRALGLLLGATMGFLLATIGFAVYASWKDDASLRETFAGARSIRWMASAVRAVKPLAPEPIRDHWMQVLSSLDDVASP